MASRLTGSMMRRALWPVVTLACCASVMLMALAGFDLVGPAAQPLLTGADMPNREHPAVQRVAHLQQEIGAVLSAASDADAHAAGVAALADTPGIVLRVDPIQLEGELGFQRRFYEDRLARMEELQRILERAREQGVASRIALVEYVPPAYGVPGVGGGRSWVTGSERFFAGSDERGAYCVGTFWSSWGMLDGPGPLGPCRIWARHGGPSPAVLAWLAHAGHTMELEAPAAARFTQSRRGLFGMRGYLGEEYPALHIAVESCLSGRTAGCFDVVLEPRNWRWRRSPIGTALYARGYATMHAGRIGAFFGALEAELGAEQFGRFWRESDEPRADLEAALGENLDEWAAHWLRTQFGSEPRGPRPAAATLLPSLLTLGLLLAAGVVVALRRQIG